MPLFMIYKYFNAANRVSVSMMAARLQIPLVAVRPFSVDTCNHAPDLDPRMYYLKLVSRSASGSICYTVFYVSRGVSEHSFPGLGLVRGVCDDLHSSTLWEGRVL